MTGDHFPNHPDAHQALMLLGVDVNRSYEQWLLELAPRKALELLALPPAQDENACVVCETPVRYHQTTCSDRCRTRLWRQRSSP